MYKRGKSVISLLFTALPYIIFDWPDYYLIILHRLILLLTMIYLMAWAAVVLKTFINLSKI